MLKYIICLIIIATVVIVTFLIGWSMGYDYGADNGSEAARKLSKIRKIVLDDYKREWTNKTPLMSHNGAFFKVYEVLEGIEDE